MQWPNVPILAAGGIVDKRTARAAQALGAESVFAGSVFISTEESRVPQSIKEKIVAANGLGSEPVPHPARFLSFIAGKTDQQTGGNG